MARWSRGLTGKVAVMAGGTGALLVCGLALWTLRGPAVPPEEYVAVGRPARIYPDYQDTVIPPNIAPLNVRIEEQGYRYFVRVCADHGKPIELSSRSPDITIPEAPWHRLLAENRGGNLRYEVFVRPDDDAPWRRFDDVRNSIAKEDIDSFLVYRRIRPAHSTWREMGIYQRQLRSFNERVVLENGCFKNGCVNCHTFCNNSSDRMLVGIRSRVHGTPELLVHDGEAHKIGATFGYTAWHPSGTLAAFSVNKVRQVFHAAANEVRDVLDLDSLIACYDVNGQAIRAVPPLMKKDRLETYPTWSPDGRWLYFCTAPITWEDRNSIPERFNEIRYDLMRISYDIESKTWGQVEAVLTAEQTGRSILLPRVSPDGRWLLVTMCDYGCFPVYRPSSDLYLIDLKQARETGRYEYRRLDINSDASESWHSFSSNGRWIAFSSKRLSHTFTRVFLAYMDKQGVVRKPFVLPQKDPGHYESTLWTYSLPEFVTEPIRTKGEALARVIRGEEQISAKMPITMATPKADAAPQAGEPWQRSHQ